MKKMFYKTLVLVASTLMLSMPVFAAENTDASGDEQMLVAPVYEDAMESYNANGEQDSSDDMLTLYLEAQVYEGNTGASMGTNHYESKLTGLEKDMYKRLKSMAAEVAQGKRSDTKVIGVDLTSYFGKKQWTQSELGYISIQNWLDKIVYPKYSIRKVVEAAFADCPYEFYWRGLNWKYSVDGSFYSKYDSSIGQNVLYTDSAHLWIQIAASQDYAVTVSSTQYDPYTVNTSKTGAVSTAISNAKAIVKSANSQGLSDYNRLAFYKNKICSLNSYNFNAANSSGYYGDPWQIIYVFDGNSSTNVVCEGYSKAFKYLCDLSSFNSANIKCYTVTGVAGGPHMWNIVQMDDKRRYHVDVTNCDANDSSVNDNFFLAIPVSGSVTSGYTFNTGWSTLTYTYDDDTKLICSNAELTLSTSKYVPSANRPSSAGWKHDSNGYWYQNADGSYPKSKWQQIGGKWYHFNAKGYMQTGWLKDGGKYYYLDKSSGAMATSKWIASTYYVKADGTMATSEWVAGKYYVDANGKYVPGKKKATAGWKKSGTKWWYQNADGSYPKSKWQKIDGKYYHFDSKGYMETSKWIDGIYYVKSNGVMATNEWVGGKYYVDNNGKWIKGLKK